jgi:hypothetical protein
MAKTETAVITPMTSTDAALEKCAESLSSFEGFFT